MGCQNQQIQSGDTPRNGDCHVSDTVGANLRLDSDCSAQGPTAEDRATKNNGWGAQGHNADAGTWMTDVCATQGYLAPEDDPTEHTKDGEPLLDHHQTTIGAEETNDTGCTER